MAVSTTNAISGPYFPNGVTVTFPFTFTAPSTSEVGVISRDADGNEMTVSASSYTVSLTSGGGGSVTFGTAPAAGAALYVLLNPHFTQDIAFDRGPYLPEVVNRALDRAAARDQWLKARVDKLIPDEVLAGAADGQFLAFAGGEPVLSSGTGADAGMRTDLAASASGKGAALVCLEDGTTVQDFVSAGFDGPLGNENFQTALSMSRPGVLKKLGEVIHKWHSGTAISVACYGDSLTYGQDTVDGQATQINGSTTTRSRYPYPETLLNALSLNQYGVVPSVANRGYPGDTAEMGFGRWASASATDVAIIMYGANDGKTLAVSISDFKLWMQKLIEREIGKSAAVILLTTPPANDSVTESNLAPYRDVTRQLAKEYEVICIDTPEQLSGITNLWQTGEILHLSTFAYAEIGWQLASLFNNRDMAAKSFVAGSMWYPADGVGYGGVLFAHSAARSGTFVKLTAGQRYFIAGYFSDDVLPVIHSYNTSGIDVDLLLQYGGNGSYRGLPSCELVHHAATDSRQALTGPVIRQGYRTFSVLNNGAQDAYLDAVHFASIDTPGLSLAWRKSQALSGIHYPRSVLSAIGPGVYVPTVDYGLPLKAPYRFSARVTGTNTFGIAVCRNRQGQTSLQDMLFALRSGTDLILRDFSGSTPTDTTAAGVFAAGQFTGEIEIYNDGTTVTVSIDGVDTGISYGPVNNIKGFPALLTLSDNTDFCCHSAQVKGYVKGPYL